MLVKELSENYVRKYSDYVTKRHNLQERINRAERQLKKLQCPSWIDEIIEPIAKELNKSNPKLHYEILGPFGICSTTSIHFYNEDETVCLSITFRPGNLEDGQIGVVNYSVNTEKFAKGTIGELNGMNYPVKWLSSETDINDLKSCWS